jgi:uncharacterized protein
MPLQIEFEPAKDARNLRTRGITLAESATLLDGFILQWEDKRRDYGEIRMIAIGEIGTRQFVCVYTHRGETYRVISLRPAKRRERNVYQEAKAAATRDQKE